MARQWDAICSFSPPHTLSQNQSLVRHGRITGGLLIIPLNPFKALFLGDRTRLFQHFTGLEMALSHFYESRVSLRNVLRLLVDAILDLLHCNVFRTVSLSFCLSFFFAGSSFRENAMCAFF